MPRIELPLLCYPICDAGSKIRRFGTDIKSKLKNVVHYICGHSGCVYSDVRSLNTTIVEGPIERHKSRLASREAGDGLTGTYSGEAWTGPDRCQNGRESAVRVQA